MYSSSLLLLLLNISSAILVHFLISLLLSLCLLIYHLNILSEFLEARGWIVLTSLRYLFLTQLVLPLLLRRAYQFSYIFSLNIAEWRRIVHARLPQIILLKRIEARVKTVSD